MEAADLNLDALEIEDLIPTFSAPPITEIVREVVPLGPDDLKALEVMGPEHSQVQVKHIRAYHHMIALRLAMGERPIAICAALGLTPQTITKLQTGPQFADLVEHYRGQVVKKAVDHVELMSAVSAEALMAIHEKLIDPDERSAMTPEMLRRLAETFTDRIGHSPVRRSESASVHRIELDDRAIERIKSLHSESRRFDAARVVNPTVDAHEAQSRSQGAAADSSVIFLPSRTPAAEPDAEKGPGV